MFRLVKGYIYVLLHPPNGSPYKEVIQPHLPVRLPCYDFTPVISPAFGTLLLERLE